MSDCSYDCSSCGESCADREAPQDFHEPMNPNSDIKKVIAVVSGKGGVGKSTVTCYLAAAMAKLGKQVAVLDADITGPSVPTSFGLHERATGSELGLFPVESKDGVKIMSINFLMEEETDPVVWRGPVLGGVVKQFWNEVIWGDIDYMFVDMPPGTGDVPLTIYQSLPIDGIVVVTSPQDLVSMIVTKAVKMAQMMNIPILGVVENYSYFQCPGCGDKHSIFGESKLEQVAGELGLPILAQLPIDPSLSVACDKGEVETYQPNPLEQVAKSLLG